MGLGANLNDFKEEVEGEAYDFNFDFVQKQIY